MHKKMFACSAFTFLAMAVLPIMPASGQPAYFRAITNLNPAAYWPLQETAQPPTAQIETNLGSLGAAANAYYSSTNVLSYPSGVTGDGDTCGNFVGNRAGAFLAVPMTNGISLPSGPFTVEAWVNPTNYSSGANTIISQTGPSGSGGLDGTTNSAGWSLNQNYIPSKNLNNSLLGWSFHVFNGVGVSGAEVVVPNSIVLGTWYHVVGVFDGVNAYLYVDGTNASSTGYQIPINGSYVRDTWNPLTIGCGRGFNNNQYYGYLDEVAIYTNALTAVQIANHYAAFSSAAYFNTITNDNPYMYWRMDAPVYTAPPATAYPVATSFGTLGNVNGLYLSGDLPGVPGPAGAGLGSPSYACAFNGIGTSTTNRIAIWSNNVSFASATVPANSGILITNLDPQLNLPSNNITVSCWFKANPADNRFQGLLGHSDKSWRLALNGGGRLQWNFGGGSDLTSQGIYNDGNWHFVAAVYSTNSNNGAGVTNGLNTLYVDGVQDNSATVTVAASVTGTNVLIGGAPDYTLSGGPGYNQRFFAGSLAHVAYFTNALTAAQVSNLYATAAVLLPPAIYAQPFPYPAVRTVTGGAGQYIFEAVVASGTQPLSFQWYENTGSNYVGATALVDDNVNYTNSQTSQVTISNLLASSSLYYFCVVTNSYGTATSGIVNVQTYVPPAITSQNPAGSFSLYPNQVQTLSVSALGAAPLVYQWFTNGAADTTAGTAATYTVTGLPAMSGFTYQCIVTNLYGSATGALDTLTVLPLPASIANSAYSTNILALNPSGYWPMHEVAAPLQGYVETNYGTLGTLGNAYYEDWVTPLGVHGSASALAGDSDPSVTFFNTGADTLVLPTSPQATIQGPMSLEAWIKPLTDNKGIGSYMVILGQGGASGLNGQGSRGGFALQYSGDPDTFSLVVWNGTGGNNGYEQKTVPTYPPGQWYHLVCTYDGTNLIYYVNDQVAGFKSTVQSGAPAPMIPDTWSPLCVGAGRFGNNGPAQPFNGQIDEVAVYTNILTAQQVQNHYLAGTTVSSNYFATVTNDAPLIYYRMDAPYYAAAPRNTWTVLTNYGSAPVNGVYVPTTAPGGVGGVAESGKFAANFSATNAMAGNGVSSFADAGIAPTLNPVNFDSFSFTAWFRGKPADPRTWIGIMSANDNTWRSSLKGNAGNVTGHGGNDISTPAALILDDGQWHQIVVTLQANPAANNCTNTIYADGTLLNISTGNPGTNNPFSNANIPPDVYIGGEAGFTNSTLGGWNGGRSFPGGICEAAFFYHTVLSSNQVRAMWDLAGVPPFFSTQPVSAIVNQGAAFTNIALANGSHPLTYQWYRDNQPLPIGGQTNLIIGATNATLILNPVVGPDTSANYYLVVSNPYGSVTSTPASLIVLTNPVITGQFPVPYTNPFTIFAGASPVFSVAASGAIPLHYLWFTNNVMVGWATNSSFTFTNVPLGLLTNYCIVTNFLGSATSTVWTASVIAQPASLYPQQVMALNPAGYWRLNEPDDNLGDGNPGVIANDYVNGNNGIYTNVALGQPGYATNRIPPTDGTTCAYVGSTTPNNSDANGIQGVDFSTPYGVNAQFTVQAWVNGGGQTSGNAGIAAKGYFNGEEFTLDCGAANKAYRFEIRSASGLAYNANSTLIANDSQWHHLVGVCDQAHSNVSFYIDGGLAGSAPITNGAGIISANATVPMSIGSRSSSATSGADQQFFGHINDVTVFKYALSAAQVQAEFNASGVPPYFITQPPSNVLVTAGTTLTVSATDSGTGPITNQWWDFTAGTNFPGQTNVTLVISNIPLTMDGHQVYLAAANVYGTSNSALATLNVLPGFPFITNNVTPAYEVVYAGNPVTYSVGVIGSPVLHYQWYEDGAPISGATSSSYTGQSPLGTNTFSCTITNGYNGLSMTNSATVTLVGLNIYTPPYPQVVLADNPIAYWRLNQEPDNGAGNNGVVLPDLVAGHNAFYTNTILGLSSYNTHELASVAGFGSFASSYSFAQEIDLSGGGTPNLDFSQPAGGNAEFSVEAWAKCAANQTLNDRIVNKGHFFGEQFALDLGTTTPSTGYRFTIRDAGAVEHDARGTIAPDGQWHHLVGVCDGANALLELFVDGVLNATNNFGAAFTPNSGLNPQSELVTIGNADTSSTGAGTYTAQLIGSVAEVALYNYPLSAGQVAAHYTAGLAQPPAGMSLIKVGGQLQLNWGYGTLQSATNVAGPFNNVPNAASPYVIPLTNAQSFYRLLNP